MIVLTQQCSNDHRPSWKCHKGAPQACSKCEHEKKEAEKRAQRALVEKLRREEKTKKHLREIAKIEEEIEQLTQISRDANLEAEQKAILEQKRADLEAIRSRANEQQNDEHSETAEPSETRNYKPEYPEPGIASSISSAPVPVTRDQRSKLREHIKAATEHNKSNSKTEWQRQKDQENAYSPAIDEIMEMIGLEEVKAQVLRIKAKVETSIRQGTDLSKERLGLVLLGNPGTGESLSLVYISSRRHTYKLLKVKQLSLGTMRKFCPL